MSQTQVGSNNNPSNGNVTTQVLAAGTNLYDENGNQLILPAGNVITSVQLKWLSNTAAPSSGAGANAVELRVAGNLVCRYTFSNIASSDHAAVIGTGTAIAPTAALPTNQPIQLFGVQVGVGTANLDFPLNAPVFVCEVKFRPMPVF